MVTRRIVGVLDMETGDLTQWSSSSGNAAQTTGAITGTFSMRGGKGTASDGNAVKTLGESIGGRGQGVLAKFNYRPRSTPSGGDPVIYQLDKVGANTHSLLKRDDADGKLVLGSSDKPSSAPSNGTAYAIELEMMYDGLGGAGRERLFVDGALAATSIARTGAVGEMADEIKGLVVSGGKTTWDEVIDDVELYVFETWG